MREKLYGDRPCTLCGGPMDRPKAQMHKKCEKRAERRWAVGLAATDRPKGRRGRLRLDQLSAEEKLAEEIAEKLERAYQAGRADGVREALDHPTIRRLLEEADEPSTSGPH